MEGDAADAEPVPMAPGTPHPAQVATRACSSQNLPDAALPTTAFAQSWVIYPGSNSAGTGIVWVSEMGLRCSCRFFCFWCAKYEQVQPRMLWCSTASGWMLDKSTVPAPQGAIFPHRAAFELLQVKT